VTVQLFRGIQYLKMDIANSFGLDKLDWSERLRWYEDNQHRLLSLMKDAENHAQYYAGVRAMAEVRAGKKNTGYLTSWDATCSGMQILSVLTGDRKAAEVCNVVDTGHRRDAYTELFEVMKDMVEGSRLSFERKHLKRAIMTAFYGSEAVPKDVFGEGPLLMAFFRTLEQETPYIWDLNKAFLRMWDPTRYDYTWVLPDNFHVVVKVTDTEQETVDFMGGTYTSEKVVNRPTPTGRSIGANITHSVDGFIVRELGRRCDYDPAKVQRVQALINEGPSCAEVRDEDNEVVLELWDHYRKSGYLSARILGHLNEQNIGWVDTDPLQDLLDSLPKKPFKVIPIHDCFRVHPNYGDDIRKQYNLQLSLIARSDMLSYLLTQLLGKQVPVHKQYYMADEVLRADYALS
jgi:hypothetical protein